MLWATDNYKELMEDERAEDPVRQSIEAYPDMHMEGGLHPMLDESDLRQRGQCYSTREYYPDYFPSSIAATSSSKSPIMLEANAASSSLTD